MKILIMGSGLLGVTTAYVLASRGHEVEVVDRGKQSASDTSFANGGQLSYSHAEPWANPAVLGKVFKWMFRSDAPLVLRPRADLKMMSWGFKFLSNCTQILSERNTITMLRLGLYSKKKFEQICSFTGIKFNRNTDGILHVFTDQADFDAAKRQAEFQEKFGCHEDILDSAGCLRIEPALEHAGQKIIGGIHAPLDESGDARQFCLELTKLCQKEYNVKFHFETEITGFRKSGDQLDCVQTSRGDMQADCYIMSLGAYSSMMLSKLGIHVPIYPMKGYSLTMPANHFSPKISMTDQRAKIVYSRLGDKLRIAGTAEFAGYNHKINDRRITPIIAAVRGLFPKALPEDTSKIDQWACLRPSTPDGPPLIGYSPITNLFINTGHGTLGWTQCAASAFITADLIDGNKPEISLDGLEPGRYL
jgi:D-amino-acid dehydrogenase